MLSRRNLLCVWDSGVASWAECVGVSMKNMTENERIAARAIAKALLAELRVSLGDAIGNQAECSQRISSAVRRDSVKYGINPLLLKSCLMRLQDGRL